MQLKKRMQGKSCFNFKEPDDALFAELGPLTARACQAFKNADLSSEPPAMLQLNVDELTDNQGPQAVNGGQPVPGNAAQANLPIVDGVVPFYILPEPRRFSRSTTFTF